MNFQLVSALIRSPWFLSQEIAETYYPALSMLLNGHAVDFDFQPFELKAYADGKVHTYNKWNTDFSELPENSVLNIPISGPLMKNDQMCGPVGMKTIGEIIQKADNSPNVKGMVLTIDSPGGQAYGTSQLASIIKNTAKPVVAYVDGMAASAAYWIASAADKVIAEPKSRVGSVGTMVNMTDVRPAFEKLGVKFHRVISDLSPEKNEIYTKALDGDYEQLKTKVLNPLAGDFQTTVKQFRPTLKDEQLKGMDYYADDVVGSMVDKMGTMQDAIAAIDELKPSTAEFTPTAQTQKQDTKMNVEHLNKILGAELQADEEGGVYLNQEQIEALETFAGNHAQPEPEPKQEPEPTQQAASKPEPDPNAEALQNAIAEIANLKETIQQMQEQPGATTAKAAPKNDPGKADGVQLATSEKADFLENVNRVAEAYGV